MELALKRAAGRAELAAELHQMLVKSSVEIKQQIEESWLSGNLSELLTHVHKLNGSTRYCGVPELESCAETLEIQLKGGEESLQPGYRALIAAIDRIIQQPFPF